MAAPEPAPPPSLERLVEIARRIEAQPWNRPGTDKAWVLDAQAEHQAFREEMRRARGVEPA